MWPGQLRSFEAGGRELEPLAFGDLKARAGGPMSEERLAEELEKCVRLHLISDRPLGVFLSAGIDSSAVANLAKKAARGPVHTFTLAFEEAQYNEGPMARRIADAIGTVHREVVLSGDRFTRELTPALDSLDQPTFDGLNSYYMSLAIREAGFTVALVGTGGDELFGGYTSFRDLPVLRRWLARARFVPRRLLGLGASLLSAALLRGRRGAFPPQTRWAKLPDLVERGDDLIALYQTAYALFLPDMHRQLLAGPDPLQDGLSPEFRSRLLAEAAGRPVLSALSVIEQRIFLGERLLRDNDAASMAASIEQRLPLVDQALFQAVDQVPEQERYQPIRRKGMLRRIGLRGLDPALFERPKTGFVLPFDRWIREGLGKELDGTFRDSSAVRAVGLQPDAVLRLWTAYQAGAPGLYWSRVWALYVLVRWCQRHGITR
jgi:asparagine synthase (glutamine-hydrolysing)